MTVSCLKKLSGQTGVRSCRNRLWVEKGYASQSEGYLKSIREGALPAISAIDGLAPGRDQTRLPIDLESATHERDGGR
jgi:hypothetical protein